jgi:hypothetical protein
MLRPGCFILALGGSQFRLSTVILLLVALPVQKVLYPYKIIFRGGREASPLLLKPSFEQQQIPPGESAPPDFLFRLASRASAASAAASAWATCHFSIASSIGYFLAHLDGIPFRNRNRYHFAANFRPTYTSLASMVPEARKEASNGEAHPTPQKRTIDRTINRKNLVKRRIMVLFPLSVSCQKICIGYFDYYNF